MLRFLQFDLQQDDAESSTWEAMASVQVPHVAALETEAKWLLEQLPRWLGSEPVPLDEGGEWDVWVQTQWDGEPPQSIDHRSPAQWGSTPPTLESGTWWSVTLTVVVTVGLTPLLSERVPH